MIFQDLPPEKSALEVYCTKQPGEEVHAYQNTTHSLGTVLFKADSVEEMMEITGNTEKYYRVELE